MSHKKATLLKIIISLISVYLFLLSELAIVLCFPVVLSYLNKTCSILTCVYVFVCVCVVGGGVEGGGNNGTTATGLRDQNH